MAPSVEGRLQFVKVKASEDAIAKETFPSGMIEVRPPTNTAALQSAFRCALAFVRGLEDVSP
jgi:hypothetical protein